MKKLEQFRKWFRTLNNFYTSDTEMRMQALSWMECCKWILEKAGENINLIEFMQEIADEAGVNVFVKESDKEGVLLIQTDAYEPGTEDIDKSKHGKGGNE